MPNRQCCSCGGCCGGGYTLKSGRYKPCLNTAHLGHGGHREGAGRKAEDEADGVARYNVSLDAPTVKKAKKLGGGNLSLGLRKAVKAV